jgi:hypothetical protein
MSIPYDPDNSPGAGPQACAAIANTMLGHFVARLAVEARQTGGVLSMQEIEAAAARFIGADTERFRRVLERSWLECGEARDSAAWDHARSRPFDRVLVKRFAHLFPARSGDDGGHQAVLSRRMIPGFHLALSMMLGPELFGQCQHKAQALIERLRGKRGTTDWGRVYSDPELRALVNDVLVVVAHHFGNFEKRRDWFMTLVNGNLARGAETDRDWRLTPALFHTLMLALFDDLFQELGGDGAKLRRRYGDGACEALREFMNRLNTLR